MNHLYSWHKPYYAQLVQAFQNQRGHHALLFKTESGLGTESLIRALAHWLFCINKNDDKPCCQCKSCLLWQSGNHPDFHLIESIDNKDIGIDQIRTLTTKLQQFSQQGGNTVVFFKEANRLTEEAANSLLKTLEEPPENVYFLLQAPLNVPMLATIQSRCQTWLITSPTAFESITWLQTQIPSLSLEDIQTGLRLAHYRPLLCKNLLETDRLSARKKFLQTFWRFSKNRDVWLLFVEFSKEKESVLEQLEWLESFFTDAIKAKLGITTNWINSDLQKGILLFAQEISSQKLLKGVRILQATTRDLREIKGNISELILIECLVRMVEDVFE